MKKSDCKLSTTLNILTEEELKEIYELMWKYDKDYTKEDLKQHIAKYIIMFYKMSSYKAGCKEKAYFLIKELEHRYEEKT